MVTISDILTVAVVVYLITFALPALASFLKGGTWE